MSDVQLRGFTSLQLLALAVRIIANKRSRLRAQEKAEDAQRAASGQPKLKRTKRASLQRDVETALGMAPGSLPDFKNSGVIKELTASGDFNKSTGESAYRAITDKAMKVEQNRAAIFDYVRDNFNWIQTQGAWPPVQGAPNKGGGLDRILASTGSKVPGIVKDSRTGAQKQGMVAPNTFATRVQAVKDNFRASSRTGEPGGAVRRAGAGGVGSAGKPLSHINNTNGFLTVKVGEYVAERFTRENADGKKVPLYPDAAGYSRQRLVQLLREAGRQGTWDMGSKSSIGSLLSGMDLALPEKDNGKKGWTWEKEGAQVSKDAQALAYSKQAFAGLYDRFVANPNAQDKGFSDRARRTVKKSAVSEGILGSDDGAIVDLSLSKPKVVSTFMTKARQGKYSRQALLDAAGKLGMNVTMLSSFILGEAIFQFIADAMLKHFSDSAKAGNQDSIRVLASILGIQNKKDATHDQVIRKLDAQFGKFTGGSVDDYTVDDLKRIAAAHDMAVPKGANKDQIFSMVQGTQEPLSDRVTSDRRANEKSRATYKQQTVREGATVSELVRAGNVMSPGVLGRLESDIEGFGQGMSPLRSPTAGGTVRQSPFDQTQNGSPQSGGAGDLNDIFGGSNFTL